MLRKVFSLVLCLITLSSTQKVTGQIQLISYDPLKFNLTFSEKVPIPKFQLLFNEIAINFQIQNAYEEAQSYIINGIFNDIVNPGNYKTQKYVLLFTEPLKVAGGRLSLSSFELRAPGAKLQYTSLSKFNKQTQYKYQKFSTSSDILSIVIIAVVYFLAYTTMIGMHGFNFVGIYLFICLESPFFTALDYRCAYYLLFQVSQFQGSQVNKFIYMITPHICILVSFILGLISRITLGRCRQKSKIVSKIYDYMSYKFFIITWGIMCIPMFANSTYIAQKEVVFTQISPILLNLYVYISITLICFYSYMAYLTVNPQVKQSNQQWQQYIKSSHYNLFEAFHLGIDANNWKKRNFTLIVSITRIIIAIFITLHFVNLPNLLLQIFYLIYLIILRPFKISFFNYSIIGIQLFVIFFYLFRYIAELFMGISTQVITSTDITKILLTNIIWLCIIIFTYFLLGIYQFYQTILIIKNSFLTSTQISQAKLNSKKLEVELLPYTEETKQTQQSQKIWKKQQSQNNPTSKKSQLKREDEEKQDKKSKLQASQIITISITSANQNSSRNQSPQREKEKSAKRGKEKSSLLQSISMGHENS